MTAISGSEPNPNGANGTNWNRVPLAEPRLVQVRPLVTVRHVSRRYGKIQALSDISLEAYPGEVLGIVGESGSGKSTILRLMNLEEPADSGEYYLNVPSHEGKNLFALDRFEQRDIRIFNFGIVYQNPHLGLR